MEKETGEHVICNHVSRNFPGSQSFPHKCATTRWTLLASFACAQDVCRDQNVALQSLGWRNMCPPVKGEVFEGQLLGMQTCSPS
eukprot:3539990-Amphidinium_carterae.1